jgi:hypothetical protein
MSETVIAFISGAIVAGISSYLTHFYSKRRDSINVFNNEAERLCDAFSDLIAKLDRTEAVEPLGPEIYDVLIKSYNFHHAAVFRFRKFLNNQERIGFDKAWDSYKYPDQNSPRGDPFIAYIQHPRPDRIPEFKRDFIFHKIQTLLTFAERKN